MAAKLPSCDLNFKQRQANLAKEATNIHDSMGSTEGLVLFPSPPVPLLSLVTLINNYTNALATARKGSKADTAAKNDARAQLISVLRINANYVTEQAQGTGSPANAKTVSQMREVIAVSGYKLSKISAPVGNSTGIKVPIVKKLLSKAPGQINVLLRQYTKFKRGTKTWQLQYREPAVGSTPAGPWISSFHTSGNITQDGVASGVKEVRIAAIGGHNTRTNSTNPQNFTSIRKIVVT